MIALTTYTATVEGAREFGVLKAVGASGGFLYRVVLRQSLIVGAPAPRSASPRPRSAANLITRGVPEFVTVLRLLDAPPSSPSAIVMAVAASYVPVRRLNRIDPAMVFRP